MAAEKIVLKSDFDRFDALKDALALHQLEAVRWQDREKYLDSIRYALVWNPGPDELARMPNLAVVFSVGAGVDHLVGPEIVPADLPVVRMVEPALTSGMVEYVVYNVLRLHRDMAAYERDQQNGVWQQRLQQPASSRTVGILGLGELGGACAKALDVIGFNVVGWSRSKKDIAGVHSFSGDDQLDKFLGVSEFLVCLLPLTDATNDIVNDSFLARLPMGAHFLNAGRGGLVDDDALLRALDGDQLASACLDVFNEEPLPSKHPYWNHPKVTMTPHVASITVPETSIEEVVANIERFRRGEPLHHLADLTRGY